MDLNGGLNLIAFITFLITAACVASPTVKFYVKGLLIYVFILLNSILGCCYGLLHYGQEERNVRFSAWMCDLWSYLLGVRWIVEVDGGEVDRAKGPYIVVCNHQSSLDTFAMMKVWPVVPGFMVAIAKKELKYFGPFGLNLALCGTIFLDRHRGPDAHDVVNVAARTAKQNCTSIWIYPEGTRNRRRGLTMLPFKKGAFHMALEAGMNILPVVISEYHFFSPEKKRFGPGSVKIRVMTPIQTVSYSKDNLDDLINDTREKMLTCLKDLAAEEENPESDGSASVHKKTK